MLLLSAVCLSLRYAHIVRGQALPIAGHSYQLYNQYPGDNPYEYLAWTTSSSEANGATSSQPGVYMVKSSSTATSPPPRSLWTFELQSDGISYYIYNTDESYGSPEKRLDVHADGLTPFLWNDGPVNQNPGQVWQLISYNDGINFQIYNVHFNKALDINGGGVANYPINGPFMNKPATTNAGEKWQLGDSTPTTSVTTTALSIQTSTVTPPIQTLTVQGTSSTVTSTSTVLVTQTITATTITAARADQIVKRAYVLTVTITAGTVFSVSTSYITLPTSTTYVANAGALVTSTITTSSTIFETFTTTIDVGSSNPSAAPTTNQGASATTPRTPSGGESPPSTTSTALATDTPNSGLTRDQQIAIGVGVPSAFFAALSVVIVYVKRAHFS